MAIRSIVESDLSGKAEAATVTFGLADVWYEIDLTDEEQKKLEQTLQTYLAKGRKANKRVEKKRVVPPTSAEEREKIRAWGKKQGFEFADQAAYDKAHNIERAL